MSLLKKLAGETALYGLSSILGRLLTFVFLTPYLTRKFMPDQMGIQTDIYAWAAFLMIIFTYRLETTFFRFGSKKEDRPTAYRTASISLIASTVVLVATLLIFAQPIATWLEYPDHANYIVYFAFILGFDALSALPFALLRLESKAMRFAVIKLLNLFIHLGAILFFLELGPTLAEKQLLGADSWFNPDMGIGYVFLANLLASAATFILLAPNYFRKVGKQAVQAIFDKELLKKMLWYAFPLVLAGFAGIINEVLDRTLLKAYLPGTLNERLTQVGIYGACYKISIFMNLFTQAFNYAAEPFFFRNADRKNAQPLYANIARLFALVGSLGFLGIMLYMDIVQYFVAAAYREGIVVVPILLLANLFLGLYYNAAVWFKLTNRTKFGAYIAVIGASLTILLNLILIPRIGYMGSAWATLACYVVMVGFAYYWGQKYYPIPYPVAKILFYIGLAVAVYFVHIYTKPLLPASLIVSLGYSTILFLVYVLIVWKIDGPQLRKIIKM
ncbi:MAG: polysaccharide biosynthesis protein [Aureispira sp.]|nr:polysaccharide biosynthesis protein [Aureispira sp.]